MRAKYNVTLIMLNYNDSDNATKFIKQWSAYFTNIVLVDNHSSAKECSKLLNYTFLPNVHVIYNQENKGFASGNDIGIRYALSHFESEVICCVNTDVIVTKELLDKGFDYIVNNQTVGVVTTRLYEFDGKEGLSAWHYPNIWHMTRMCGYFYKKKHEYNQGYEILSGISSLEVDVVRGSLMFFNPRSLEKVGLFDEGTFLFNEENIICTKLKKEGYKIILLCDLFYIHNHPHHSNSIVNMRVFKANLQSTYYYFRHFTDVGFFLCLNYRVVSWLSIVQQYIINAIKSHFTKRRNKK